MGIVVAALLALAACVPPVPSGPTYRELAANESFATTMPGACDAGFGHGSDPRSTIDGSFDGFATRALISQDTKERVVAWHRSQYEARGWRRIFASYIALSDGMYGANYAWRSGDLVVGLGFPTGGWRNNDCPALGPTVYELTITYYPDRTNDGEPRAS